LVAKPCAVAPLEIISGLVAKPCAVAPLATIAIARP
jgi:hypothetical protein